MANMLKDKVVLVTGAGGGIGREMALLAAKEGASVVVNDLGGAVDGTGGDAGPAQRVVDEITAAGGEAVADTNSVATAEGGAAIVQTAVDTYGRVDVVVNNAGILRPAPVVEIRAEDLDAMLRVNLFGALYVMQEALTHMHAGTIVNVASLAGRRGMTPLGGYCATKFALVGLTEALRTELDGRGLHVALVMPGVVDTPMAEVIDHDPDFLDLWPAALNMPPSWVVWAIFAAVRFGLVEVSVPPGAATLEKLASLAPGMADTVVRWARSMSHWVAEATRKGA